MPTDADTLLLQDLAAGIAAIREAFELAVGVVLSSAGTLNEGVRRHCAGNLRSSRPAATRSRD
jgi:hypothetical protein